MIAGRAPGRPKPAPIASGTEPRREQSSGLFAPGEELGRKAERGLQGRPTYPLAEGLTGSFALLTPRELSAPLAWCGGQPVSAATFIAEAQALAATLPGGAATPGRAVNLCQDRYHFALGLAAAMLRGHTSLMPPNALPQTLRSLQHGEGAIYAFVDGPEYDTGGLHAMAVQRPASVTPAREVPLIDARLEAVRLLTSGSTGAPQPHGKRWGSLVANIGAEAERLAELLSRDSLHGLTLIGTVPAQHSYGFESTVMLALLGGACFEGGRPFYPADIADALKSVPAPRALVTTPFHLKTLLRSGIDLPATALVLSATAPLSPQLAAEAEARLQATLVEIYGCTEAGQVASRRSTAGETWHTLGALRIAQQGETFIVSGGHVAEPTPLADVLVLQSAPRPAGPAAPQGDLSSPAEPDLLSATHFKLLGRANDLIHVGGKRSSLAHLNYHLNRIDGVDDGAFWLPEDDGVDGDAVVRPIAFVVAPTLTAADITKSLRAHVEAVFVPRRLVFVDALPREATGKLTTDALRAFASTVLSGAAERSFEIGVDHPAFEGHFPGRPLLPGVVLLSLVLETLAGAPALRAAVGATPVIDNVKFLAPVGPGSRVVVSLRPHSRGVAFDIAAGNGAVARGLLLAGGGRV